MTAALGRVLIFKLDGAGAGLLQGAHRMGDIDGVAEARIGVDDQRQIDHAPNGHGVLGDLAEIHETEVRQAEMHICQPRAGQIDRLEAEIRDDPGRQSIRSARQQHAFFAFEQRPQRRDVCGRHRTALLVD